MLSVLITKLEIEIEIDIDNWQIEMDFCAGPDATWCRMKYPVQTIPERMSGLHFWLRKS